MARQARRATAPGTPSIDELRAALREVDDPEYPVSVIDLGLVRDISVSGSSVRVEIAFCSLGCPCIELIHEDIEARLARMPGVGQVEVVEVYERWTAKDITPSGRLRLRAAGVT